MTRGSSASGGMSRAAKKRAKKRQKEQQQEQEQQQRQQPYARHGVVKGGDKAESLQLPKNNAQNESSKMKKKLTLPFDNDSDGHQSDDGEILLRKKNKRKHHVASHDDTDDDSKESENKHKRNKALSLPSSSLAQDEGTDNDEDHNNNNHKNNVKRKWNTTTENDSLIISMLSKLKPVEILFPYSDDATDDNDDGNEQNQTLKNQMLKKEENDKEEKGHAREETEKKPLLPEPHILIRDVTSETRARCLFDSLLHPVGITADEFYNEYWEKKPLLISMSSSSSLLKEDDDKDRDGDTLDESKDEKKEISQHQHRHRLDGFLSKSDVQNMLVNNALRYGCDLNVTRYDDDHTVAEDGGGGTMKRRVTLDLPPKRIKPSSSTTNTLETKEEEEEEEEELEYVVAEPNDVWSNFNSGCTIRLLCPQKHIDSIHALLSALEQEFGCMVGSNAYLTPGGRGIGEAQGFAPHYDDIEAFVLQLEGAKRWRVYPPFNRAETLPRVSSRDFTEKEMEGIKPVIDVVLKPGDILYMPRGWIHQAHTLTHCGGGGTCFGGEKGEKDKDGGHSLHLTVSAMQNWAWVDLLELIMPEALEAAACSETSTSLREGLPRNFLSYMGAMHDTSVEEEALPEGLRQAAAANGTTAGRMDGNKMDSREYGDGSDKEDDETRCGDAKRDEALRIERTKRLQAKFKEAAKKRIMRVCKEAITLLDAGCDQIGKRFLSDRLPPALTLSETALTSENRSETGRKIWPNTLCRLIRPGIARLVLEDSKAVVYHCVDNSRVYHGTPLSPLEFEVDDAPALEMLLTTVEPHWVCVKDLIHGDIEDKMEIAQALYDEGILAIFQADKPDKTVQVG